MPRVSEAAAELGVARSTAHRLILHPELADDDAGLGTLKRTLPALTETVEAIRSDIIRSEC